MSACFTPESWALLWSQSQRCFHIEQVCDMLAKGQSAFARGRGADYVPLFIGTRSDCEFAVRELRRVRDRTPTLAQH